MVALRSNEVAEYCWWPLVFTIGPAFRRRWHIFTVYTVFLNCFDGKKSGSLSSWNPNSTSCTFLEATSWLEVPCPVQHHYRCRNSSAYFPFHFLFSILFSIFISSLSLDCKAKLMVTLTDTRNGGHLTQHRQWYFCGYITSLLCKNTSVVIPRLWQVRWCLNGMLPINLPQLG